jgi:hypothetical protein
MKKEKGNNEKIENHIEEKKEEMRRRRKNILHSHFL